MQGVNYLKGTAKRMKSEASAGAKPEPEQITVRNLLREFAYQRRTKFVVSLIRNTLENLELRIVPDFEFAYIDSTISILLKAEAGDKSVEGPDDPTVRIGALAAANRPPTFVNPN